MKTPLPAILLILYTGILAYGQEPEQITILEDKSIHFRQIVSDTLFGSCQRISLLILDKEALDRFQIEFAYQTAELQKTSQIAESRGALAAINGGFFDRKQGGSVCYFEINDSVISRTRSSELKWAVPDSLINGALILNKNNILAIEAARLETSYENSNSEAFAMISGPLLISESRIQRLPDMNFIKKRHPRTCVGISQDAIIFIAIDGRSEQANGMNLMEVQDYLLYLGCTDAINLDGGGSTCMWIKDRGVVNMPSDKGGERSVANALLIRNK